MSGVNADPIQILDDEPDEDDDPEEYNVEAIRAKRRNAKTGVNEYLIKWENYPESANTWEPSEHLKCPDIITRFNEEEKQKRKRRRAERLSGSTSTLNASSSQASTSSATKRTKISNSNSDGPSVSISSQPREMLLLENDDIDEADDRPNGKSNSQNGADSNPQLQLQPIRPEGFERGLPVERIVCSSVDDKGKLWFFIKWQGHGELEMVEADEVEEKSPHDLCRWYRERLYWSIENPSGELQQPDLQQPQPQQVKS